MVQLTGEGVHIALITNYVQTEHAELEGRVDVGGGRGYYTPSTSDRTYHGTAMAALTVGEENNVRI